MLALDYGTRRIGLAISDPLQLIAQPLDTWDASDARFDDRLADLAREWDVELIVVGLPLSLGGGEGTSAEGARRLAARARAATNLEVVMIDERYTSAIAEQSLLEADASRASRKEARDRVAAAVLLQGYLDGV
ncbi:MAG: Holliday junction resolvase RuvX [Acidimicrobiia bacterium]